MNYTLINPFYFLTFVTFFADSVIFSELTQ